MFKKVFLALFFLLEGRMVMALTLTSPVFDHQSKIPAKFTCDGEDLSPALSWQGEPSGTKSFVLIMDDPDAPPGTWIHWVVYNIPAGIHHFDEGLLKSQELSGGILQGACWGVKDMSRVGYYGPCPPPGKSHRYFFKLYAVDTVPNLKKGATKEDVLAAINGHTLAQTELVGLYGR